MTEGIKVYPKEMVDNMKNTLDNTLKYIAQAEKLEKENGHEPVVTRLDEQGKLRVIVADREVRAIWDGIRCRTTRDMKQNGYQQSAIEIYRNNLA